MSNFKLIADITRTHIFSRVKQSSIAALGVTFGIGAYIILISFMTGLNGMLDDLVLDRTPHIQIYNEIKPSEEQPIGLTESFQDAMNVVHSVKPKGIQNRIHNSISLLAALKEDERILGVTPQANTNVFYLAGSIQLNGMVSGIIPSDEARLFNLNNYIVDGSIENLEKNNNGILLGSGIADKMSLKVGDRIQVNSISGGAFPLKIVGLFQSGMAAIDDVQSYVNLKTGQQLYGEGSGFITNINVKLKNIDLAPQMSSEISETHDISAYDIQSVNSQFDSGTTIRNLITYAVSIALLIVAGFGIYNILNMYIYEKMDDIAILKATGFSDRDVQQIFISQALIIGTLGGLLGLVLGYGVSVLIDFTAFETPAIPALKTYPVNYNPVHYVTAISFAIFSTFLAGYLPARRARKMDPVEIIRGR